MSFTDNWYEPKHMQVRSHYTLTQMCSADNWYVPTFMQLYYYMKPLWPRCALLITIMCGRHRTHITQKQSHKHRSQRLLTYMADLLNWTAITQSWVAPKKLIVQSSRSANLLCVDSIILSMPHLVNLKTDIIPYYSIYKLHSYMLLSAASGSEESFGGNLY